MGLVTGYICAFLLLLLLLKYVARRCGFHRLNKVLMKWHKYVAFGFLALGLVHLGLVIGVLGGRNIWVTVSGILLIVASVGLTICCHVMKDRNRELELHRLLSVGLLVLLVLHMAVYFVDFASYQKAIGQIDVKSVSLENVEDGIYSGECDCGYISAKVKVMVKNHEIEGITLVEHRNERGKKAEAVVGEMLKKQDVKVDAVTGATNSSMVIMKACEDALRGAKE